LQRGDDEPVVQRSDFRSCRSFDRRFRHGDTSYRVDAFAGEYGAKVTPGQAQCILPVGGRLPICRCRQLWPGGARTRSRTRCGGPPSRFRCECGETRQVPYGDRWDCEQVRTARNTAQIPAATTTASFARVPAAFPAVKRIALRRDHRPSCFVVLATVVSQSLFLMLAGPYSRVGYLFYMPAWRAKVRRPCPQPAHVAATPRVTAPSRPSAQAPQVGRAPRDPARRLRPSACELAVDAAVESGQTLIAAVWPSSRLCRCP